MRRHRLTYQQAQRIDKEIMDLALYDTRKGLVPILNSMNEMTEFQKEVMLKFNHFKTLIQLGEWTLVELTDDVVARNAAIGPLDDGEEDLSLTMRVAKWDSEKEEDVHLNQQALSIFSSLLQGPIEDIDALDRLEDPFAIPYDSDLYNTDDEEDTRNEEDEDSLYDPNDDIPF